MTFYRFDGLIPVVHPAAYVHPSAVVIGDVQLGADCYVGPNASLRADFGRIAVRAGSNIQDCCVVHCFPGEETLLEPGSHIGHGAVLHGCHIGEGVLVGMNAVVMDGARIGAEAIIAATSFVAAGFVAPPRTLVAGSPARVIRELDEAALAWRESGGDEYVELARRSRATMTEVEPLTAPEAGRRRLVRGATSSVPLHAFRTGGDAPRS